MDKEKDTIYIACSSDENYVPVLAAMLKSLSTNHRGGRRITVYILEFGLSGSSKERISSYFNRGLVEIKFINVSGKALENLKVDGHISYASYCRLLLPNLLPLNINKVIYLDCDLIINGDIEILWEVQIGENYLLAVQEQGEDSQCVSSPYGLKTYKELGLQPDCKYFNAGVLVISLEKWRREGIGEKIIEYIKKNRENILWHDQDGLNAILAGKWGELDYRWNLCTQIFNNTPWNAGPVKDKKYYDLLINEPYIVHYNTGSKAWQANNVHPYRDLFFYYLNKTPWKWWRPRGYFASRIKRLLKTSINPLKSSSKTEVRKINFVYFSCKKHFDSLFISLKSLINLDSDYVGKIYLYIDKEDFFVYEQVDSLARLNSELIIRKCDRIDWGGEGTILNELRSFKEISEENNKDDYLAKVDSDVFFVSERVFFSVLKSKCLMFGQKLDMWKPFIFTQGGCYFLKNDLAQNLLGIFDSSVCLEALKKINNVTALAKHKAVDTYPEDATIFLLAKSLTEKIYFENFYSGFNKGVSWSVIHFRDKNQMSAFAEEYFKTRKCLLFIKYKLLRFIVRVLEIPIKLIIVNYKSIYNY